MHEHKKATSVAFVSIRPFAITNSRLELIHSFLEAGAQIYIVANLKEVKPEEKNILDGLTAAGVCLYQVSFSVGRTFGFHDILAIYQLSRFFKQYPTDLLHTFNLKTTLYTFVAGVFCRPPKNTIKINTVTGFGSSISPERTISDVAKWVIGNALSSFNLTIFQNSDDYEFSQKFTRLHESQKALIISSGVNCERFAFKERASSNRTNLRILMVARIIRQKGIQDFLDLQAKLSLRCPNVRFSLIGEYHNENPDSYPFKKLQQSNVEYLGFQSNLEEHFWNHDIFVSTSTYNEGVPRSLIEAASTGLPIVSYKIPGTSDVVIDGVTGHLVEKNNMNELLQAVVRLVEDDDVRKLMGQRASLFIKKNFNKQIIIRKQTAIYRHFGFIVE